MKTNILNDNNGEQPIIINNDIDDQNDTIEFPQQNNFKYESETTNSTNSYNKEKGPDIMISFNAKTMKKTAKQLKLLIQKQYFTVFISSDITAGTAYREEINAAAFTCRVFIALINEEWASSKECDLEYNIVLNRYLHPSENRPLIIPVIIGDWEITKYNSLIALKSIIQFIKVENIEEIFNEIITQLPKP